MNYKKTIKTFVTTLILIAFGVILPMLMPKLVIEPMSFTLASHVPLMLALCITPETAVFVAIGTTAGYLLSNSSVIIIIRAFSHVFWVWIVSNVIQSNPSILGDNRGLLLLNIITALLHGFLEMLIVIPFYYKDPRFLYIVGGLVGIGTIIHSFIDFFIATYSYQFFSSNARR